MPTETPTNVLIMNPYFSLKGEELDVRLHERSFKQAMDFVAKNRERVRHIFLMADVPPFTSRAAGIFGTKADTRSRKGLYNLRHLEQFHPQIIEWYRPFLGNLGPKDILVLTESRVKQIIIELPAELRQKLPRCNADGSTCGIGKVSCRAITAVGMNFCLTAGDINQAEVFIQEEDKRTEFITMMDASTDVPRIFGHRREQLNLNFCE